ncbi:putative polysaccharide biosynthesis protein [Phosphitispora sp. TUW77]|uniref:putative polysaccharide biosynthesis protein n=1 Tax=Phosphitispora sp. TUW77 TaxID=3152361 RepID=UPI003AB11526
MKTHSFLKGAAILALAGLVSKVLGALYRIPFFRVVGAEGMGLYQMAYPIYTMLLAISSAGIPVAVSKIISENAARRNFGGIRRSFAVSLIFVALLSGFQSIMLYKSAVFLAVNVFHVPAAVYSIRAIAPAVFFVGMMSVFRGYFQGFQEMTPTALSQVLEQFIRVATVLVGAYIFLSAGIEYASAAATFGAVTGGAGGLLFLIGLYFIRPYFKITSSGYIGSSRQYFQSILFIIYRLCMLALPISLGALVLPLMQTLDAVTVPGRLQLAGYSISRSSQLYGQLTGVAITLINLPTVFTVSLASSLVPAISRGLERRSFDDVKRQIKTSMEITMLVCIPAVAGLIVLASPISNFLFRCPEAGLPLAVLAPAALFLGLHQTTTGILQGMGKTFVPVINLALGVFVKLIINYTLVPLPQIGIVGAAVGTTAGFLLSSYMNYLHIRSYLGGVLDYRKILLKPVFAATIMAVGTYFAYSQSTVILGSDWATVAAVFIGIIVYFTALSFLGILDQMGIIIKK